MIKTELQDLSFLTPRLPETSGSFLTGLAKGFTKSAMKQADAEGDTSNESSFPGLDKPNGEIGPTPPEAAKQPGFLEKISGFFTDPVAMQKYRQERAQTKVAEQKASLGEVLQRDLSGVLQQFRDSKTTEDRLKLIQDNAGLSLTPEGNHLLSTMTQVTGNLERAEQMTEAGMQRVAVRNEMKDLMQWGFVPGAPATAVQARKNRFMVNHIMPVIDDYNPFEITTEMWDEAGNPRMEMIYSTMSKAGKRTNQARPAALAEIDAAGPYLQPGEREQLIADNARRTARGANSSMQVVDPSTGNVIFQQSSGSAVPIAIGNKAQEAVDTAASTLDAVGRLERIVKDSPESFGVRGVLQGLVETAGGVVDPNLPQDVNQARKDTAIYRNQLVQGLRADVGKMDMREELRTLGLVDFDSLWTTPQLVNRTLQTIKEVAAIKALRQWQNAGVSRGREIPPNMVEIIKSPVMAASLVKGNFPAQQLKGKLDVDVDIANSEHIESLFDSGLIDQRKADDLIVFNAPRRGSNLSAAALARLGQKGVISVNGYDRAEKAVREQRGNR